MSKDENRVSLKKQHPDNLSERPLGRGLLRNTSCGSDTMLRFGPERRMGEANMTLHNRPCLYN